MPPGRFGESSVGLPRVPRPKRLPLIYRNYCAIISRALISSQQGGYMVGAASDGSLLERPKSGIAARLPKVAPSKPPRPTDPHSFLLPARRWQHLGASSLITCHSPLITRRSSTLIAGEKILKTELTPSVPIPNAFLIAGDFPPFSPAAPRISNRYTKLLEIELTHSQQTRKHFLIATICPTLFSPAPLRALLIGTPRRLEI